MARRAYIDPRVFGRYLADQSERLPRPADRDPADDRTRARLERPVLKLLDRNPGLAHCRSWIGTQRLRVPASYGLGPE